MKILIKDLQPATKYSLQARSVDVAGAPSKWSRTFTVQTEKDLEPPSPVTGLTAVSVGDDFYASWTAPTTSAGGGPLYDFNRYEVTVTSSLGAGSRKFLTQDNKFSLTFATNLGIFGTPRGEVTFSVTAVDNSGNVSTAVTATATNPPPAPVTGLTAFETVDGVSLNWDENTTDDDLKGYEVRLSLGGAPYVKVYAGTGTSFMHSSSSFLLDHVYRVFSVDKFNTYSTHVQTDVLKPKSPFTIDTTPPGVPTDITATITTTGTRAALNVSWTNPPNPDNDLSTTIVAYRPTGSGDWSYSNVDYTEESVRIEGIALYTQYDVKLMATDWFGNSSGWSTHVTTSTAATNSEPGTVTGVTVTPGRDSITVKWTENPEDDVKNGAGVYRVDISDSATFASGVLNYTTGGTTITVTGLSQNVQYYARVKAVDSSGLESAAWSSTASATTGTYPTTPSDGNPPAAAPTDLALTGGIDYLFVSWSAISNADPVTYDIFMSTTNNFTTYNSTTHVGEINGTAIFIERTAAGAALTKGTTYYVKVRPRDVDGTGPVSSQVSGSTQKVGAGDVGGGTIGSSDIVVGASSFIRSSNFAVGTAGWRLGTTGLEINDGIIDAKAMKANSAFVNDLFIGAGGAIQSTGYTSGGDTGFSLSETGLTIKGNNNYVAVESIGAGTITAKTINIGTGGVLNVDATGQIISNNYSEGSTGYKLSNTGLEINDGSIDAKALKTNTAIIGDLTLGRDADNLGSIKSFGYTAGVSGFRLSKQGLEINEGTISAAALTIQTGLNMMPPEYADFEYGDSYYISSLSTSRGQGKMWVSAGIANSNEYSGSQPDYKPKFGSRYMGVNNLGGTSAMETWFGTSATNYNIQVDAGSQYILSGYFQNVSANNTQWNLRVKGNDGNIITTFPIDLGGGTEQTDYTRVSTVITIPAGITSVLVGLNNTDTTMSKSLHMDGIQFEPKTSASDQPSVWKPPISTTVGPSGITTGFLRSATNVSVNGVDLPTWSINMNGNMQMGNAHIRGSLTVGSGSSLTVTSPSNGDFESAGTTGFAVYTDGSNVPISRITDSRVITGTGSLLVNATASTPPWNYIGAYYALSPAPATGQKYRVRGKARLFDSASKESPISLVVRQSWGAVMGQMFTVASNMVHNTVYSFDLTFTATAAVNRINIFATSDGQSPEQLIIDDVYSTTDNDGGDSFVQSSGYIQGNAGWKIFSNGATEFNEGVFRGVIISGNPDGARTEIENAGIITYTLDADGNPIPAIKFNTGQGDEFSIYNNDGSAVASIGSDGGASFKELNTDYLEVEGISLQDWLDPAPRGLVAIGTRTTSGIPTNGTVQPFLQLDFVALPHRVYRILTNSINLSLESGGTANRPVLAQLRPRWGASYVPALTTTTATDVVRTVPSQTSWYQSAGTLSWMCSYNSVTYVSLLITYTGGSVTKGYIAAATDNPVHIYVEDMGSSVGDVMDNLGEIPPPATVQESGDPPPPVPDPAPTKKTYTSVWNGSNSECYNGSGNERYNTSDLVQGDVGTSNGNCHSHILFGGNAVSGQTVSLSTAMSGATVKKVEVFLYTEHTYYNDGGTLRLRASTGTSLSGTAPSGTSKDFTKVKKGSGRWFDITSLTIAGNGTIRSVKIGKSPTASNLNYYMRLSQHNHSTTSRRPKLRITYVK